MFLFLFHSTLKHQKSNSKKKKTFGKVAKKKEKTKYLLLQLRWSQFDMGSNTVIETTREKQKITKKERKTTEIFTSF